MTKSKLIGLALLAAIAYVVARMASKQPAPLGQFTEYGNIYNPNGGATALYNYQTTRNGGYAGPLGNLADGNPYSIGL